jgi:hypothetical protein
MKLSHGLSRIPTYDTWMKMHLRCRNEFDKSDSMYLAKGTLCDAQPMPNKSQHSVQEICYSFLIVGAKE